MTRDALVETLLLCHVDASINPTHKHERLYPSSELRT